MDETAQVRPGFFALALRRRWRLVVAGCLVGLVLGLAALTQLPTTYTSQAKLYLNPLVGNPYAPDLGVSRTDQLTALQTEAELIGTATVGGLAVERSAVALPTSPEDNLSASVPSNSQVIVLAYSAAEPAVATAGAQAFAEGYLEYRAIRAAESNASLADLLRANLERNAAVIDDTEAQLAAATPGSATELQLQGQLGVYAEQQAELQLSLNEATGTVAPAGEVISAATGNLAPSGLPGWLVLAAAALAGLGLGAICALAREHGDERVRDPDELTALGIGHPLAEVSVGSGGFALDRPAPAGFRLLLTAVAARTGLDAPVTCVVGQPAAAREVAAGLAATAYRLGRTSIVIGADQPVQWSAATLLAAAEIVEAGGSVAEEDDEEASLVVVPLDLADDLTEEFVLSPDLREFVIGARETGSLVCLAGGSTAAAAGQRLALLADLTLVVVELDRDTFGDVIEVVERLHESGVAHVGLVVTTPVRQGRRPFRRNSAAPALTRRSEAPRVSRVVAMTPPLVQQPRGTDEDAANGRTAARSLGAHGAARR